CDVYPRYPHEDLARLYQKCLRRLADEKCYVHLYLYRECKAWELIEHNPALTVEDRLFITNFFRENAAHPKEGIGYVRALMRDRKLIQGNHETQAACGVFAVTDFLKRHYPDPLHEQWYQEALVFFEPYRTAGSYLGDNEGMQSASVE